MPFLRFAGTDSVKVKPDQAEVQVTATATEKTSAAALDEASRKLESVLGRMRQLGIADEDLTTDPAYTYQDYESKDWVANVTLRVTVRDTARAGDILTEANAAGADSVSGPYFSVENEDAAYAEALKKAIDDARAKADAAAAQMGVDRHRHRVRRRDAGRRPSRRSPSPRMAARRRGGRAAPRCPCSRASRRSSPR